MEFLNDKFSLTSCLCCDLTFLCISFGWFLRYGSPWEKVNLWSVFLDCQLVLPFFFYTKLVTTRQTSSSGVQEKIVGRLILGVFTWNLGWFLWCLELNCAIGQKACPLLMWNEHPDLQSGTLGDAVSSKAEHCSCCLLQVINLVASLFGLFWQNQFLSN